MQTNNTPTVVLDLCFHRTVIFCFIHGLSTPKNILIIIIIIAITNDDNNNILTVPIIMTSCNYARFDDSI